MHCINLFTLLRRGPVQRTGKSVLVVSGFVLTLGATVSWGQVPATNDTSDLNSNTGGGTGALGKVTTGGDNTAYGASALKSTTTGTANTAIGLNALLSNTTGSANTATGTSALFSNTTGSANIAVGWSALSSNSTGGSNIAVGFQALRDNSTGSSNTAFGQFALLRSTGSHNLAVGTEAGSNLTDGDNNIYLGHKGRATESLTMRLGKQQTRTFIAGIVNTPLDGSMVLINDKGQLGTPVSSARYKRDVQDMRDRSQGLRKLRPVTFRYKQDSHGQRHYGLLAEEVARVYPELVVRGATGEVESVQYHELIPLLLNEVQHQQQTLSGQARQLRTQSQELAELRAQNTRLHAALEQRDAEQRAQTAALTTRLEQLEHAPHGTPVAAR